MVPTKERHLCLPHDVCRDTEGLSFQAVCSQSLLDHSRRASQELQLQPFSCSANLIVSINFKTYTFP